MLLIGLYVLILIYGLAIALRAQTQFGRLAAMGLVAIFFVYAFINMAMVQGLVPVVGIPLPFMSYGGSSTVANFAAVGLVLNVHMRRFA